MTAEPEFVDPNGDLMVPLRCPCGEQIGLKSPSTDMSLVVPRCYACATTDEANEITREAA